MDTGGQICHIQLERVTRRWDRHNEINCIKTKGVPDTDILIMKPDINNQGNRRAEGTHNKLHVAGGGGAPAQYTETTEQGDTK